MGIFKIKESDWNSFLPSQFKYSTLNSISSTLLNINGSIISISDRIDSVDRISGINYSSQAKKISKAVSHMSSIESYVNQTIGDVEDILDDEFFSKLNDENGALERLQLTADKKYTTKNTLGITQNVPFNEYNNTSNAYMNGQVTKTEFRTVEKPMIGFEDIFHLSNGNSKFKGFSGLLKEQCDAAIKELNKKSKDKKETIDINDYMNSIINAGKFDHTVDKGWKNWASTALDAIGIVALVSKFTGNDFVTGEKYTDGEKDAATLNIVFSIVGFATLGIGKGVQIGGKAVAIYIAGEMAANLAIKATTGLLDEMGAPKWLQSIIGLAEGIIISNKVQSFMNTGVKSLDDIVKVGLDNIDDIKKFGIKNIDDLINIGVKNVDDLIKAGVKNSDDLLKIGIKNIEDLAKLGIKNADDLIKFGIKNVDDLAKLGIKNMDDLAKVGIKNANDLAKLNIKDAKDFLISGLGNIDDAKKIFGNTKIVKTFEQFNLKNFDDVWKLKPTDRGNAIEAILAETDYKNWWNCGQDMGGYFPVVDFQDGLNVVSLKSIDPSLPSYLNGKADNKIMEYIKSLDRNITIEGKNAIKKLDVRIPTGTKNLLNIPELMDEAKNAGIILIIKEF